MKIIPSQIQETVENQAIRVGDILEIKPIFGPKRKIELKRTLYHFISDQEAETVPAELGVTISLPHLKGEEFSYQLKICPETGFYVLESSSNMLFRINGQFCFRCLLCSQDRVIVGRNELYFTRKMNESMDTQSSYDIPPAYITSDLPIMIEGETGTGKSTLAKWIHEQRGAAGKFVHLNLSSFSPLLLESELFGHVKGAFTGATNGSFGALLQSHKGTLFLDEIDSLPKEIQVKLLLFLDHYRVRPVGGSFEKEISTKIIFASGRNLRSLLEQDILRKDFYYRLMDGLYIRLPPLRENKDLIKRYLVDFEKKEEVKIDEKLKDHYLKAHWPGNFRQLQAHLHRKKILCKSGWLMLDKSEDDIAENELNQNQPKQRDEIISMEEMKRNYALEVYQKFDRQIGDTAEALQVSSRTLKKWVA